MSVSYFVAADGFGECELLVKRNNWSLDDELVVLRADPKILVTRELLNEVAQAESPLATLKDDVLTLHGSNQKVIYRIGEFLPERGSYVAEWPD